MWKHLQNVVKMILLNWSHNTLKWARSHELQIWQSTKFFCLCKGNTKLCSKHTGDFQTTTEAGKDKTQNGPSRRPTIVLLQWREVFGGCKGHVTKTWVTLGRQSGQLNPGRPSPPSSCGSTANCESGMDGYNAWTVSKFLPSADTEVSVNGIIQTAHGRNKCVSSQNLEERHTRAKGLPAHNQHIVFPYLTAARFAV